MREFFPGSTLLWITPRLRKELNFVHENVSQRAGFNPGFPENVTLDAQLGVAGEFILSFSLIVGKMLAINTVIGYRATKIYVKNIETI